MLSLTFPDPPIDEVQSDEAVLHWRTAVIEISEAWLNDGGSFITWLTSFQILRSRLLRTCWARALPDSLKRHVRYILMGSAARGEDLLASDLDFAVLHDDDVTFSAVHPHLQTFIALLHRFGVPPCHGFVMGTNRRWIGTADEWKRRITEYFAFPDWENSRYLFMLVDSRPFPVEGTVWSQLTDEVCERIRRSEFICWEMAHLGIHKTTAIDMRGQPKLQKATSAVRFPIKEGFLNPLIHSVRLLALTHECRSMSTLDRVAYLEHQQVVNEETANGLRDALIFGWRTRLLQQIMDLQGGQEPVETVDWRRLGEFQRQELGSHLQVVKAIERDVHRTFRKPG